MGYPEMPDKEIESIIRLKIQPQLPAAIAGSLRQAASTYREKYRTIDFPYVLWWRQLLKLVYSKSPSKAIKQVEAEKEEDLEDKITRTLHKVVKQTPCDCSETVMESVQALEAQVMQMSRNQQKETQEAPRKNQEQK